MHLCRANHMCLPLSAQHTRVCMHRHAMHLSVVVHRVSVAMASPHKGVEGNFVILPV